MYRYITHGIIAFLTFSEKDSGAFASEWVREMDAILPDVLMAARLYGTKTMIALGGANDYAFLALMTAIGNDPASPKLDQTVRNVVDYVTHNSLDGVDLDLECWWGWPGEQDQGGRTKSDGPHPAGRGLTLFARKLKEAMPDKIVSAAVFWKEAAKRTPALVAGQYFDQPTKVEDKGVGGLWGIFDVSNEPSPVPAFTAAAKGDNDCMYCLVHTLPSLDGLDNVNGST